MIKSLRIQGYRCFRDFRMTGLGRVNLLVGKNNSGKTSVLEAILLLASEGHPREVRTVLARRGEFLNLDDDKTDYLVEHLFSGHELSAKSKFTISSGNGKQTPSIRFSIVESDLEIKQNGATKRIALLENGGIRPKIPLSLPLPHPVEFVTPFSSTGENLLYMWGELALTPDEDLVVRALRFVDPSIERIAPHPQSRSVGPGAFKVKIKGQDKPVPIGSFGDGIWRMLSIAISLVYAKGGYLLVDEIDTGLHYTVMDNVWRMLYQAAKEFDIQVFATTHSLDCVRSLAVICEEDRSPGEVTIQRISADKPEPVRYTEGQIKAAAEHDIEVR
ncbi:MAG: AAA family ATPase [Acidobacteria bacterium]|nr:AAA family ATPase [Acidobacteriota bacterium]